MSDTTHITNSVQGRGFHWNEHLPRMSILVCRAARTPVKLFSTDNCRQSNLVSGTFLYNFKQEPEGHLKVKHELVLPN